MPPQSQQPSNNNQDISFKIKVIQANPQELDMTAKNNDTFKKAKKMIRGITGLTPKKYHLIYKGKPCDEYLTLENIGISNGDVVHMASPNNNSTNNN